jgi:hypothetical protein
VAVVIDDRLLLDVLSGKAPPPLARELSSGEVFTTSLWCYRLGRAAYAGSGVGILSGPLASLDGDLRHQVLEALQDLPEHVGLLHPRVVIPVMMALQVRRQLNVLSAESLSVAVLVSGRLMVTSDSPVLHAGAEELGVPYDLLS